MRHSKFAIALIPLLTLAGLAQDTEPQQRHFVLRYAVKVKDVPAGKEFRIWIPLAHSDAFQDVQVVSKQGDLKLHKSPGDANGNIGLLAEAEGTKTRDYRFTVEYDVVRTERKELANSKLPPDARPERASQAALAAFLVPDRLAPLTGLVSQTAMEETKSAGTPLEKARAIYDFVVRSLQIDSAGSGCCQGDVNRTLTTKRGDSTDLAAVFVAMARSQGIPARLVTGFRLPSNHSAELPAHASWAEFYATGWLPADPASAVQEPARRESSFGSLDANRMQFTTGRDLTLSPPQESAPVNFWIDPYVEVEGKPYPKVSLDVSFRDVGASAGAGTQH